LQILHQLEDKQKALELYLSFLKDLKLWNRVCVYVCMYVCMLNFELGLVYELHRFLLVSIYFHQSLLS